MQHGISFIEVDNTAIQMAIANKVPKDTISYLKQQVSYDAVYGFNHEEKSFSELGNILNHDYGFSPFKYASVEEGAIYNVDKHPNAWGRVRGRENVNGAVTWLCLDIDDTTITDEEMHLILGTLNHHICRTSDKDNQFKYRIILELSIPVTLDQDHWKPFITSIGNSLGVKIDTLGRSQVFFGYEGRTVYSHITGTTLDPTRHIQMAKAKVIELEEKRASAVPAGEADAALQRPFSTFDFAYNAQSGEGTTKLLAAIHRAKELGASREYMTDLVYSVNNFWDHPMPLNRLQSTVLTAI